MNLATTQVVARAAVAAHCSTRCDASQQHPDQPDQAPGHGYHGARSRQPTTRTSSVLSCSHEFGQASTPLQHCPVQCLAPQRMTRRQHRRQLGTLGRHLPCTQRSASQQQYATAGTAMGVSPHQIRNSPRNNHSDVRQMREQQMYTSRLPTNAGSGGQSRATMTHLHPVKDWCFAGQLLSSSSRPACDDPAAAAQQDAMYQRLLAHMQVTSFLKDKLVPLLYAAAQHRTGHIHPSQWRHVR